MHLPENRNQYKPKRQAMLYGLPFYHISPKFCTKTAFLKSKWSVFLFAYYTKSLFAYYNAATVIFAKE